MRRFPIRRLVHAVFPRRLATTLALPLLALAIASPAAAVVGNGRLQIIHLDVGQGDGAVLISPLGQVAMIDNGVSGNPTPANGVKVPQQLQALGVTHVDHHFASHYHADHIGLTGQIFGAGGVATLGYGWDRGQSYTTATYTTYVNTLGTKRRTLVKNQVITLDSLSAHPVTIRCVDLAGAGTGTTDENGKCLVLKVSYGEFDAVFGGDLISSVETVVAAAVGVVESYKVHHHGSSGSSNATFLAAIQPRIGVISCGTGNSYGHPTSSALTRLHNANVKTYWTETGAGVAPNPAWDKVSNHQVILSATWEPGGVDTVRGNGFADTFTNSGTPIDATPPVVALGSPDGGEDWKAGSVHAITWSASDNVGVTSVDLAYSTDGGASYPHLIANGIANTGGYDWSVPNAPGTTTRVRVAARDAAGNPASDASSADFTVSTWTIVASAGAGGSITPSGNVAAVQGTSQTLDLTPDAGFQIEDVLVDGGSVGAVSSYAFENVAADHTISATFTVSPVDVPTEAVASVESYRPTPNPFAGSTHFSYVVKGGDARVEIAVFDLAGRRVRNLVSGFQPAGSHTATWDGLDAAGSRVKRGIYFIRAVVAGPGCAGCPPRTMRVAHLR